MILRTVLEVSQFPYLYEGSFLRVKLPGREDDC